MTISEIFNKMDWGTAPENDKNAKAWLKENGNKFGHFINGNSIDAKNHFKTKNLIILFIFQKMQVNQLINF